MDRSIRVLIVDDEVLGCQRIHALLAQAEGVEVIGECHDGVEALEAIQCRGPDVVFLDVQMPELSGLDVVAALAPEQGPQVVFVTAYDVYMQRAFEVHALDYLRKPFTDCRFYDALQHARHRVEERRGYREMHQGALALLADFHRRSERPAQRLVIREPESGVFRMIPAEEIDWIEAWENGVRVHAGKASYTSRHTLAQIEYKLDSRIFVRLHRSFIVNSARIRTAEHLWKGDYKITLENGKSLATGRSYRTVLESMLDRL
jgi:two-component system LytT family response regulator